MCFAMTINISVLRALRCIGPNSVSIACFMHDGIFMVCWASSLSIFSMTSTRIMFIRSSISAPSLLLKNTLKCLRNNVIKKAGFAHLGKRHLAALLRPLPYFTGICHRYSRPGMPQFCGQQTLTEYGCHRLFARGNKMIFQRRRRCP